jgi:drug/metabolite transporter (DMT)-like permease
MTALYQMIYHVFIKMISNRSFVEIHIAVVLFGLAGLFGKWLELSPVIIVLGRVFFASLALGSILILSKQNLKKLPAKNTIFLFFLGILLAFHWICFFRSIQVSSVAVGLLSYSSFPLFTAILEPLFFRTVYF